MVILEALNAEHGDCLLLRYEDRATATPQLWLIDGGPAGTWAKTLKPRLAQLAGGHPLPIRLGIVTHVDSDHIRGLNDLASALRAEPRPIGTPAIAFAEFWFNGFTTVLGGAKSQGAVAALAEAAKADHDPAQPVTAMLESIREGSRLLEDLAALKTPSGKILSVNSRFASGKTLAAPPFEFVTGVSVEILGPSTDQLERLKQKWAKDSGTPIAQLAAEERRDTSATNLSSIVLLVRLRGRTLLLTGDALADEVVDAWAGRAPTPIDVMKVPHHGAVANNSEALFRLFPARHYLICANGRDGNPDARTLDMLFRARPQGDFTLHLTATRDNPAIAAQVALIEAKAPGRVTYRAPDSLSVAIEMEEEAVP